jgi:NAD dependent epimerase/dehydratase
MASGETVLVTGAGGFIGSHLVEALLREGRRVRAFVRYNGRGDAGQLRFLPAEARREVEVVFGDLRDANAVQDAARGVDVLYHLGALIGIPYSYVHPRETVDTNVTGTLNVLCAARERGVRRIVHTSTSEVYGTARSVPITEAHPLQGQSPYSASKIGADMLAESFHRAFGLPVVTIRPFNTYGPRQSMRAVIPTIAVQALRGDVVRLGSLAPTRDLNFVTDTVDGFVRAGSAPGVEGRLMNLARDEETTIGALAEKIVAIVGRPVRVETDASRLRPKASEVERLRGDSSLARELLGWSPAVSLDEGLRRTVAWVRENLDAYAADGYQV